MSDGVIRDEAITQRLLVKSRIEADDLQERDLLCPHCGFKLQTVYSDASGHFRVKCPKCKRIHVLNLAYFRRIKRLQKQRLNIF